MEKIVKEIHMLEELIKKFPKDKALKIALEKLQIQIDRKESK